MISRNTSRKRVKTKNVSALTLDTCTAVLALSNDSKTCQLFLFCELISVHDHAQVSEIGKS